MLKIRILFFALFICVSSISVFAQSAQIVKEAYETNENHLLMEKSLVIPQSKTKKFNDLFVLNNSKKVFWNPLTNSFFEDEIEVEAEGPVIGFACYVACKAAGGSASTCRDVCTVVVIIG